MPLPIMAIFMSAPSCAAVHAVRTLAARKAAAVSDQIPPETRCGFSLFPATANGFYRLFNAHPARHGEIILRVSGVSTKPGDTTVTAIPLAPSRDAGSAQTGERGFRCTVRFSAWKRQPVSHRAHQHHAVTGHKLWLQRGEAIDRPPEVSGHHPLYQRGVHHAMFQIFAGSGTEDRQVGRAARQRGDRRPCLSYRTGVP